MKGYQWGEEGRIGEMVQRIRSIIGRFKIDWGMETKELICTTHGHELRWGAVLVVGGCRTEGNTREKKWDNCNSIINKIYLKNF